MTAVDDLDEIMVRAARAGTVARSAGWWDRAEVGRTATRARAELDDERAGLRRSCDAVSPSPAWSARLAALSVAAGDEETGSAAVAEADAAAAVAVARIALGDAYLAVLRARLAAIDAGDVDGSPAAVRGYRPLPVTGQVRALAAGLRDELRHIAVGRPRHVAVRLGIGLGLGLAYLGFLMAFRWDREDAYLPYLSVFALSVVMGGVVCTNMMSVDAARVRAALSGGTPLWQVLLRKNLALGCVVGTVGIGLCAALAWVVGDASALVTALGELFTMLILWLGVGNVLSVARPLRHEPITARFHDGTFVPFLVSFAVSYGVGYVVNLMLLWRVWAQRSAIAELGGPWIPVLLTIGSATVVWVLLTVVAVALADRPAVRRGLLREMVVRDPVTTAVRAGGPR